MLDVTLEEPLPLLDIGRLVERHDAREARVEMLHEPLDRAALAGGVAPLEEDDELLPGLLRPDLDLQKLGLKFRLLGLVGSHPHLVRIGVGAGFERMADRVGIDDRKGPGAGRRRAPDGLLPLRGFGRDRDLRILVRLEPIGTRNIGHPSLPLAEKPGSLTTKDRTAP